MLVEEAKNLVLNACNELVKSGLIVRTWGNISCRIDKKSFAITPSGKDYNKITVEDIVVVNISDLSYKSDVKPSTEIGIHREAYRLRPDINFIIHTHQLNASILSTVNEEIAISSLEARQFIGNKVISANHALPGSNTLSREFKKALLGNNCYAILLSNHGAVCMGTNYTHAFQVAYELEKYSEEYIQNKYNTLLGKDHFSDLDIIIHCISSINLPNKNLNTSCNISNENLNKLCNEIYATRPDIKKVIANQGVSIKSLSKISSKLNPLFDDFAQIVGTSINVVSWNKDDIQSSMKTIIENLKGRNAVLIDGFGALCCGYSNADAEAVSIITEKQCKAYLYGLINEKLTPINKVYCKLMRYNYIKKYSKIM